MKHTKRFTAEKNLLLDIVQIVIMLVPILQSTGKLDSTDRRGWASVRCCLQRVERSDPAGGGSSLSSPLSVLSPVLLVKAAPDERKSASRERLILSSTSSIFHVCEYLLSIDRPRVRSFACKSPVSSLARALVTASRQRAMAWLTSTLSEVNHISGANFNNGDNQSCRDASSPSG